MLKGEFLGNARRRTAKFVLNPPLIKLVESEDNGREFSRLGYICVNEWNESVSLASWSVVRVL